jgi:NAD(P)H-dependent FMN reductase
MVPASSFGALDAVGKLASLPGVVVAQQGWMQPSNPNRPTLRVAILLGSVREQRKGIRVARFLFDQCTERGHKPALIDPGEYALPLLDKMYKEYAPGEAPAPLERLAEQIIAADAYIVTTAEYNHTVPPALANLLDHFLEEYFYKASAIVSYSAGRFGGVRAAVTLRSMLAELGMPSIPSALSVPHVSDEFDEEGRPRDRAWVERAAKFLTEFEWYADALRNARLGREAACPERSDVCQNVGQTVSRSS